MDSFQWDQSFLTGISDVDDQHHHLVNVINRFGDLVAGEQNVTPEQIEEVFRELSDYTHYHFSEEEAFMEASAIDQRHLILHKKAHQSFIHEIQANRKAIIPGDIFQAESVMKFLTHWLAYHILGTDQSMSRQIAAIKEGMSPATAFDEEQKHQESSTGPLLKALNGLFQQVSDRNRALSDLNQTLEQRVEQRTLDLAEANRKLEVIALTDVLTGLPNRRHAMQILDTLWQQSTTEQLSLSCMMIDADGFKQINDTYGHDAGDEVLRQLSDALKQSAGIDNITARLGGDEFLIICPAIDIEAALLCAEKVRQRVDAMQVPVGSNGFWQGSVSVGVACRAEQMTGPDDLIKAADTGVYKAKEDGRNCVRSADQ